MKYINGDLIKDAYNFDVIGHGCNCFWSFGAGIALSVKNVFPEAYKADLATKHGDIDKLGTYSKAEYDGLTILNLYTQYRYGRDKMHADYDAIRNCMKLIKHNFNGKKIGLPLIGAGLAGGDWSIIEKIIEDELVDEDVAIVLFDGPKKVVEYLKGL